MADQAGDHPGEQGPGRWMKLEEYQALRRLGSYSTARRRARDEGLETRASKPNGKLEVYVPDVIEMELAPPETFVLAMNTATAEHMRAREAFAKLMGIAEERERTIDKLLSLRVAAAG